MEISGRTKIYGVIGNPIKHTLSPIMHNAAFKKLNLDFAFFYGFNYLKGSQIWEDAFKEGKLKENEMFRPTDSESGLGNFTSEELREKLHYAYKSYYFSPKYLISQFFRSMFRYHNFRVFRAGLKLILEQRDETLFASK